MRSDLIPVGSTVRVKSEISDVEICQVIDIRVRKYTGEVFYLLGHIIPRDGWLSWWPKKISLDHLVRGDYLEVLEQPSHGLRLDPER